MLSGAMPFSMSIDADQGITRVWFDGAVTGRTIIAATNELVAQPVFREDMDQLWVFLEVTSLDISPEDMEAMVAHDSGLVEEGVMGQVKVAIVVTDTLRHIAARLYQKQMEPSGQDVRLFTRESAAEAWLRADQS